MNAVPAGLNQSLGSALTRAVSETSGPGIASRIAEITRTAPQPSSAITFARRRNVPPLVVGDVIWQKVALLRLPESRR